MFSLLNELDKEYIETNCSYNLTRTVYRGILKFIEHAWNSCFWILLFWNGSFYELSNPLFISFMWGLSVFIGQKCCVHAHLHVPPIRAGMRDTCMNPDVEFTVFRIVFYEILVLLGINFITKSEYFTRLWYYFRIQHMITPKAGTQVGLLTFRTIRFSIFDM